jgi:hypothetical protein
VSAYVYAYEPDRNPATGEPLIDEATGEFRASASPMLTVVCTTLRTPLGRCYADPSLGVDWSAHDKLRVNSAADAAAKIRAALKRYVDNGSISNLDVTVETAPDLGRLLYRVAFTDVRLNLRLTTNGTV